ncbi:pyruvate dehydrogenase (acetyl-transferring) E1 component subunit alpha [Candidatus Parvarchaeota archaeon]|nr:MAG: pyruvate dehydrogenase (acetyl-transferring) E1 component subunit alpha [Candidatus Parvarchaeota archaeon]HIG52253.1 pyruvate dehydrogenase (acetyl-transferring) E1 component subunit alpha [Candidatus Pacearchaeota archaeon]
MEKIIGKFQTKYLQILDEFGKCDEKNVPKFKKSAIKKLYEYMILTRAFDDKALKLQRQGRIGTFASTRGQEACQIGSALAIKKDDLIFPAFRENGVYLMRGMPMYKLFSYWAGDERGMIIPENVNLFPISITVGAHLPHAVGAAMSFKIQKKKAATMVFFGDGATSEGDFHESMNFAGVYKAPVVFICQNNQWAISVPVKEQTSSATIAQKAIAYGFEGIRVDGNDVFAVYRAVSDALKKARSGKGPTLIECFTYRISDHTTSDEAKKYRDESEVEVWKKKDPIDRLKKYMLKKGLFSDKYEKNVLTRAEKIVSEAVEKSEALKDIKAGEIFEYMYEKKTPDLIEQQKELNGGLK